MNTAANTKTQGKRRQALVIDTPYGIAEAYAAGELSQSEMRTELLGWKYASNDKTHSVIAIKQAYDKGLISFEDYSFLGNELGFLWPLPNTTA